MPVRLYIPSIHDEYNTVFLLIDELEAFISTDCGKYFRKHEKMSCILIVEGI